MTDLRGRVFCTHSISPMSGVTGMTWFDHNGAHGGRQRQIRTGKGNYRCCKNAHGGWRQALSAARPRDHIAKGGKTKHEHYKLGNKSNHTTPVFRVIVLCGINTGLRTSYRRVSPSLIKPNIAVPATSQRSLSPVPSGSSGGLDTTTASVSPQLVSKYSSRRGARAYSISPCMSCWRASHACSSPTSP